MSLFLIYKERNFQKMNLISFDRMSEVMLSVSDKLLQKSTESIPAHFNFNIKKASICIYLLFISPIKQEFYLIISIYSVRFFISKEFTSKSNVNVIEIFKEF